MKAHVFISVLAFHVVVIAGLYLLSACSSSSSSAGPSPDQTRSGGRTGGSIYDQYAEPNRPSEDENLVVSQVETPSGSRSLDPAFNSGSSVMRSEPANTGGNRFEPTRPSSSVPGRSQPVLNEFPEDDVLQPLTTRTPVTPAVEYQVKSGDSLWKISKDFGVSLNELLAANGLKKDATIQIGQKLVIPSLASGPSSPAVSAGQSAPAAMAQSENYTVQRGDTLSRIAQRFNTTVNDIKVANGLRSDVIQLGQVLTIPTNSISSGGSVAPAPVAAAPRPAASQPSSTLEGDIIHEVKSGETPGGIAQKYGITTTQLMKDNGISDARSLRVGQKLAIRLSSALPAAPPAALPSRTAKPPASQPLSTPAIFDESVFDDLEDIPEVEVVPRS